jgi:hypothetical protein
MPVNEEEKRRIIDLYFNQHKTIREVCRKMGKSSHDITPVTKEYRMLLAQNYAPVNRENDAAIIFSLFCIIKDLSYLSTFPL